MNKRKSITKISSMILALVIFIGCFSFVSVSAARGTKYKFIQNQNYLTGTYSPATVTETINGGTFNGTRTICFENVLLDTSVTVVVKDKKGNVKTYSNLKNGSKFGVPAGFNTVTFKCNLPKNLSKCSATAQQWFFTMSRWYWK